MHEQGEPQAGDVDAYFGEVGDDVLETVDLPSGATASFDGGSGTNTVRSTGSLAGYTFTNVQVLENAYQIRATTAQINQFALITDSYVGSDQTDIFLTSGGTVDFSTRLAPGLKLHIFLNDVFGNTVIGGPGDDRMEVPIFNPAGGAVHLEGGGGNDTLLGGARDDFFEGGPGNDYVYGSSGFDTVSYAHATAGVVVSLANPTAQNTIGAGIDTLDIGTIEALVGSAHNDVLTASNFGNTLDGGAGNDRLTGGLGPRYTARRPQQRHLHAGERRRRCRRRRRRRHRDSTISRSLAGYAKVEKLTLLNVGNPLNGTGNNLANSHHRQQLANTLKGMIGNDTLLGWLGNDTLIGGAGLEGCRRRRQ